MADRPRFGPAGKPIGYKGKATGVPRYLRSEGLDAFEFQAVRWGARPGMKKEDAEELGREARRHDVLLSMHASYFINLCADGKKLEDSIRRLLVCLEYASYMGAYIVVFHPGFYKGKPKEEALEGCIRALRRVRDEASTISGKLPLLGPETTGKPTQLGDLEEIIRLCEEVEGCRPVVDWAHIHAREGVGSIRGRDDYLAILRLLEERLGSDVVENLHTHFTRVEFSAKGELKHHRMDEVSYGPEFAPLAELMAELGLRHVVISESPILDRDALVMKKMVEEAFRKLGRPFPGQASQVG
ncbi:MAG TPA: deoxyribonuclease IV [Candidatus Bathyarchaeota archaeon]|nr:deoxyribonuclease IV [Candidatus Bathyarchaeota archaeon]